MRDRQNPDAPPIRYPALGRARRQAPCQVSGVPQKGAGRRPQNAAGGIASYGMMILVPRRCPQPNPNDTCARTRCISWYRAGVGQAYQMHAHQPFLGIHAPAYGRIVPGDTIPYRNEMHAQTRRMRPEIGIAGGLSMI